MASLVVLGAVLLFFKSASATFLGNGGDISWGDTTLGRVRMSAYSFGSPGTFGTSFRPGTAPSASAIQFTVTKAAPTRNEKLTGYQLNNGRLYIADCTGTCSATANLTASMWSWSTPTIVPTNTVTRAFDIAYEQESGRAMVVYAGNTTGELYYCIWDGSSWGPVSSCAPTNGVNNIPLTDGTTSLTGTPEWVRLVPQGEQFTDYRSNNMLLAVQDTNRNIFVISWNGSSWNTSDSKVLTTTGGAQVATSQQTAVDSPAFDVGYETDSGMEMAVYANGTALNYSTSTGSGWSSATTIQTLASAAQWIQVASDPQSNRMSMIAAFGSTATVGSTATAHPYIWKSDGTTASWTTSLTTLTMAQDAGQNVSTAWEKSHPVSGTPTPQAFFGASANANTTQPDAATWTQSGGLTTWTALTTASNDIIVSNALNASPNSDIITMTHADRDGRMHARTYSGSAWGALITTNLSTTLINETTTHGNNQTYIQKAYQFAYTPYATWSLNWHVYSDYADATPTSQLANENATPQVQPNQIVRLRMNYAELGGGSEGDTRKKLQYSSGSGCPDSASCVWTDVGASGSGSIWRYSTSGGLADNATVPSTLLDSSTADGYSVTNGTASASGDQQTAGSVQEYDYTLQNNGATLGTTYYFRGYDYGPSISGGSQVNLNAILREQTVNTAGTALTPCGPVGSRTTCTYPSMESFSAAPQAPTIYVPLNGDTGTADAPIIQLRSLDEFTNYVQYVIQWCPSNSWPCPSGGGSFDQTATQSGWSNQDADSGLAYNTSSVAEVDSTMGEYQVSPGVFTPNTTYYLRAESIDPGGSDTFSSFSSTVSFTTAPQDVRIQGGTTINGGTTIQ